MESTESDLQELKNHITNHKKKQGNSSKLAIKFALTTLHLVERLVKSIFTSSEDICKSWISLRRCYLSLNLIKPFSLVAAKDLKTVNGSTPLDIVDRMSETIQTRCQQHVDLEYLKERFRTIEYCIDISDIYSKMYVSNIRLCLSEMREVLIRATGNHEENFSTLGPIPFITTEYFYFIISDDYVVDIRKQVYPMKTFGELSEACKEIKSVLPMKEHAINEDLCKMGICVKEASTNFDAHKKNLSEGNHHAMNCLRKKLLSVVIYLLKFRTYVVVKNFKAESKLGRKIMKNVKEFCLILHSLPLIEVLRPSWNRAISVYFGDIIYVSSVLSNETKCFKLRSRLKKLKLLAYQLYNMSWKQVINDDLALIGTLEDVIVPSDHLTNVLISHLIAHDLQDYSLNDWGLKFLEKESVDALLQSCPYEECRVCLTSFFDILEKDPYSADLVVLPQCVHLFCLQCMRKILSNDSDG